MARGFLLAGILGPVAFGIWTKMKIVLLFLHHGQLGVHEAMLREIPLATGAGHRARARRIESSSLGFELLTSAVIACLLVVVISLTSSARLGGQRAPWLILAALLPASQIYWFVILKLRAEKRFRSVARQMLAFAASSTLLGVAAAHWWGVRGALAALAVSHVLAILLVDPGRLPLRRPTLDMAIVRRLIRIGLPIMASSGLLILLWYVDKIAIWVLMSSASLGIYALPSYLLMSVNMLPEAIAAVIYPRLMERLGKTARAEDAEAYLVRPCLVASYLTAPLMGMFFLALHLPLQWALPRYAPGIGPGQILVVGLFFTALARVPGVVLVSLGRQMLLLGLTVVSLVFCVAAVGASILVGGGLEGAAAGAVAGYVLYSVLVTSASIRAVRMPLDRALEFAGRLLLPFAVTVATVIALIRLTPSGDGPISDLLLTGARCAVVLVIGAALVWRAHSRHRLFSSAGGD